MNFKKRIAKIALNTPVFGRYSNYWYGILGVHMLGKTCRLANCPIVGDYSNIYMHENSEINMGCLIIAKDRIEIGENSTIAYGTTILTSSNPNGPRNRLSSIYPSFTAPVIIGDNVWVGAGSVILPGVTIGNNSVIAAGSVVTKNVPSGVMVAGNPANIKKQLSL